VSPAESPGAATCGPPTAVPGRPARMPGHAVAPAPGVLADPDRKQWLARGRRDQTAAASTRLARQIRRDEAIPARDKALAELAEAQAAVLSLKDAIIRRSGQDEWRALWGEVQKERERA
jgi:hypothetical protein